MYSWALAELKTASYRQFSCRAELEMGQQSFRGLPARYFKANFVMGATGRRCALFTTQSVSKKPHSCCSLCTPGVQSLA